MAGYREVPVSPDALSVEAARRVFARRRPPYAVFMSPSVYASTPAVLAVRKQERWREAHTSHREQFATVLLRGLQIFAAYAAHTAHRQAVVAHPVASGTCRANARTRICAGVSLLLYLWGDVRRRALSERACRAVQISMPRAATCALSPPSPLRLKSARP